MNIFNRGGLGLQVQFLLLSVISFIFSQADPQFSDEYLNDIRSDAEVELAAGEYNYDNQGTDWTGTCQNGKNQSPIDLISKNAVVQSIKPISFRNYDQSLQMPLLVVNNGHIANMVIPVTRNGQRASISGGLLPGEFEAQSVHFHWGSANSKGSEHTIDSERYDAEIHIVHKNMKYANLSVGDASEYADGLAVLGVMLRATSRPSLQRSGLNRIFDELPNIIPYESNATISSGQLTVRELLGGVGTAQFFSYNGSLTTPDCSEAVTWTVFKNVASFPQSQISKLWNLQDSRQRQLINNYRVPQDLNDRQVYYRKSRF